METSKYLREHPEYRGVFYGNVEVEGKNDKAEVALLYYVVKEQKVALYRRGAKGQPLMKTKKEYTAHAESNKTHKWVKVVTRYQRIAFFPHVGQEGEKYFSIEVSPLAEAPPIPENLFA